MLVASHSGKVMVDVWSQVWLSASLHLRDFIVAFSFSSSRFDHVGERKSSRVRKAEPHKLLGGRHSTDEGFGSWLSWKYLTIEISTLNRAAFIWDKCCHLMLCFCLVEPNCLSTRTSSKLLLLMDQLSILTKGGLHSTEVVAHSLLTLQSSSIPINPKKCSYKKLSMLLRLINGAS